jgi:hypothetical protein
MRFSPLGPAIAHSTSPVLIAFIGYLTVFTLPGKDLDNEKREEETIMV